MSSGPAFSSPATIFTGRNPFGNGWYSDSDDDGVYILNDAWLAVFGANATVTFGSGTNIVSFNGPSSGNFAETVIGSGGSVIAVHAAVTLTGDNDIVYFDRSDDVLNLTAATAGAWSTLYANSGVVNLTGASMSVVGGGVTVNSVSGVNAVSLYQTNGVADSIAGDDMSIALVNSQAVVDGDRNTIWFVGGSGSTVTVNSAAGSVDTVYGAGTIEVASGAVASVGGGALIDFLSPGGFAAVSYTQGIWDRIEGAAGTTNVYNAQVVVYGGNQIVRFTGGDDNAASLYQTNGNWDSVYGLGQTLTVNSAQVNIFGGIETIYVNGSGSEISIYTPEWQPTVDNNVYASHTTLIINSYGAFVKGGGDTLFIYTKTPYDNTTLSDTNGVWDTVVAKNTYITLYHAQASVIGGGNSIYGGHVGDAVSIYDTAGNDDFVVGAAAVTLNDAEAQLSGSGSYIYFNGGANTVDLSSYHSDDILTFAGAFGRDTVHNFNGTDSLAVSASEFTDFQIFQQHLTQVGGNAVLTLDADDQVTFVSLGVSAITSSQVKFI